MHLRHPLSFLVTLLAFASTSCGGTPTEAVADAVKNQPNAKAFAQLFPASEHFITHYTGAKGPRVWNSHVLLHERYVLAMQFDMALAADGVKVTATAPPKFFLREVTSVTVGPSRQSSILYGESVEFGPDEWK
ncbi:MAG: hypothetical protein JWO31_2483, partial [Phycisphaerales bacterium]|nr:hypothetical protein [Phycisphaerales bacterium]